MRFPKIQQISELNCEVAATAGVVRNELQVEELFGLVALEGIACGCGKLLCLRHSTAIHLNKVGVDRQIADERMAVGEGKGFLFTLLADQTADIFNAIGAGFERLGAGAIDGSSRVAIDKTAYGRSAQALGEN